MKVKILHIYISDPSVEGVEKGINDAITENNINIDDIITIKDQSVDNTETSDISIKIWYKSNE